MTRRAKTTSDDAPISKAEMIEMFGEEFPPVVINLIYSLPDETTFAEARAMIRALAKQQPPGQQP